MFVISVLNISKSEAATGSVLLKKVFLKFIKIHRKTPVLESQACNLIKKRL